MGTLTLARLGGVSAIEGRKSVMQVLCTGLQEQFTGYQYSKLHKMKLAEECRNREDVTNQEQINNNQVHVPEVTKAPGCMRLKTSPTSRKKTLAYVSKFGQSGNDLLSE
ncbi:hypothetical protein NDU88_007766 [Pleurodeles waltl]|uniref:Uncharacterized protein n=1 Tax=Pleurodeles waltl TaxID=8319 RepID=A0AAV7QST5_PLEWA|nr:hypothetical protein NDU88_007766 [Pleurodeles waltl]